jgi:hypothetical protein
VDLSSLQSLMQYNNWHKDTLSENNPWNAISARGDLVPAGGRWVSEWIENMLFGGMDTKVTPFDQVCLLICSYYVRFSALHSYRLQPFDH